MKLKELPNERLEGSWGALWLGIRTFFGFKLGVVGLHWNPIMHTLLAYFTYLHYLLTLLTYTSKMMNTIPSRSVLED